MLSVSTNLRRLSKQGIRMLRLKTGIASFSLSAASLFSYTFYEGPLIESEYIRFALAGTASTVIVELLTHAIDTVNMRSKVINGPKIYVISLMKFEGISNLFRGVQAVLYGYVFSSMLYFYAYISIKDRMNLELNQRRDAKQSLG